MNNKKIEKSLRSELRQTPDVWERINKEIEGDIPEVAPVYGLAPAAVTGGAGEHNNKNRNKNIWKILMLPISLFMVAVILLICLLVPRQSSVIYDVVGYIVIDINPSVQLVLDKNGKVTQAKPLNEDARTLLAGKTELVGKSGADAAKYILDYAMRLGYISPVRKNNAILVSAQLADEKSAKRLQNNVRDSLMGEVKQKGVYCVVLTDVNDSDVADIAASFGISESKMRLILTAQDAGAVFTEEEIPTVSVADIYERMSEAAEELEESLPDDLKEKYEEMLEQSEKNAEAMLERIEEIIDGIEDELEDFEGAEDCLERMKEILELTEDALEAGLSAETLFGKLYQEIDGLALTVSESLVKKIEKLKRDIKNEIENFQKMHEDIHGKFLKKSETLTEKNKEVYDKYKKDKDYDKLFGDWLDGAAAQYSASWEKLKQEWRTSLDVD